MSDHRRYMPILKAKGAEFWALGGLKESTKEVVAPVFEVVPPSEKRTIHDRVKLTAGKLYEAWQARRFYIDMKWVSSYSTFYADKHVVDDFFAQAGVLGLDAVPVTAFDRDPGYQQATAAVVKREAKGLALRLSQEDMADPRTLSRSVDAIFGLTGVGPDQVDLILDYGDVRGLAAGLLSQLMRATLAGLPHLRLWRSLAVSGSSFPPSLSELPPDEWTRLPRKEWIAWNAATSTPDGFARPTIYGDYAIGAPDLPAGRRAQTASLRYSALDEFFVWRGTPTKDVLEMKRQFLAACEDLVWRPEYSGREFSAGDLEIHERAASRDSPGEPKDWRSWATSHYLELVASQLASLPAP